MTIEFSTLQFPLVMGILNATPDSFFEGSRIAVQSVVDAAGAMLDEGATILDIGGQSTRPGAVQIGATAEADRVVPAIEAVIAAFPQATISVDTYHASVAKVAIAAGATMVNDISAGDDDAEMLPLIAASGVTYIAMHKQGRPETMQNNPVYTNVVEEVLSYFTAKKSAFESLGICNWILDPGFGFGKTLEHNYSILANLHRFCEFGVPVLAGMSRKGMIQKALQVNADGALNGTTAANMVALQAGASILRVHDVKEAMQCVALWKLLQQNS